MALQPYVESVGSGPDLVLLHGWGLHSGIWQLVQEALSMHYRLTLIDLPGFGRSPLPNGDYSLEMLTEQVLQVAPEKAHYLGWSLGGLVATQIALQHPGRVDHLITVASNPYFLQHQDWPGMKPEVMDGFCRFLEEDYEGTLIRFLAIQALGSETQKQDIQQLKDTVFLYGTPAKRALRGGLSLLHDADLRAHLPKLRHPMLRLYGRLDSLVPSQVAEAVKKLLPHSEHQVIPKASHAPFLSHRQAFVAAVRDFLPSCS